MSRFEESKIQQSIIKWSRFIDLPLIAIPNGANVSDRNRKRLVAEGLASGFPDLFLFQKNSKYAGLAIEVKTEKGRLSPGQKVWIKRLEDEGYKAIVVRGSWDGIKQIEEYLKG